MIRSMKMLAFGLSLIAGLAIVRPAAAQRVLPAFGSAAGEVQVLGIDLDTGEGEQTFEVDGNGSVIGKHKNQGTTFFNIYTGEVSGFFTATMQDASTITGSFEGSFVPVGPGPLDVEFTIEVTWQSGTGRFVGISGGVHVDATQAEDPETGDLLTAYDYFGEFILP